MAYEVYRIAGDVVLDVQASLIRYLNTRVVVPLLRPEDYSNPVRRLNPVFNFQGEPRVMVTQFLAAVSFNQLGRPIGDLAIHQDQIKSALDLLFDGF